MLFESTKTLLRSILQSLEKGDDIRWDDYLESGNQCVYELHQMARPSRQAYRVEKPGPKTPIAPDSERAVRAIPHVKLMVSAIRRQDLTGAITSGKAGFGELTGAGFQRVFERPAAAAIVVTQPIPLPAPAEIKHHHKPAAAKNRTTAKRRPGKVATAASRS